MKTRRLGTSPIVVSDICCPIDIDSCIDLKHNDRDRDARIGARPQP